MTSHKILILAFVMASATILLIGCASSGSGTTGRNRPTRVVTSGSNEDGGLDFGEDWAQPTSQQTHQTIDDTPSTYWTILLRTYKEFGHDQLAANTVRDLNRIDPRLAHARVHTTRSGSTVIFGMYDSADDPTAQADLNWVKNLKYANRSVFPMSMLTRINARHERGEFRPNELLAVRREYPDFDPLYSVQIAVWGDFESDKYSHAEIRRRAENYTSELRAQGYEAFFHHDEDQQLSMVTVGLFDHRAFNAEAGVYSPEVNAIFRAFPAHLVNGQPLQEPKHPRKPELGTITQKPKLVLVPKLR